MTPHNKLIYEYRKANIMAIKYKHELYKFLDEFFEPLNCASLHETKDSGKYLLLTIYPPSDVNAETLIDYAIRLSDELDMDFQSFIQEIDYSFEDNKKVDTQTNEYRILFEKRHKVT